MVRFHLPFLSVQPRSARETVFNPDESQAGLDGSDFLDWPEAIGR
jgi:hypothetical protein